MTKNLCLLLFPLIALCGCSSSAGDDVLPACTPVEPAACGSLVISSIDTGDARGVCVATRLVDAGLCIDITAPDGSTVVSLPAGHAAANAKIELAPGEYTLHAYTPGIDVPFGPSDLGAPRHQATAPFTITAGRITYVALSVPMVNAAVRLVLPDGFDALFTAHTFTVTAQGRTVALANLATAYFDTLGEASYTLSATNADGETMTRTGTLTLEPGHCHDITFTF